jgi:hypothetical protein
LSQKPEIRENGIRKNGIGQGIIAADVKIGGVLYIPIGIAYFGQTPGDEGQTGDDFSD